MTLPELLRRAVFVTGPTSVGKSTVALAWARECGGEIVCADAFQLYRELSVLSAQPGNDERDGVPHHLYGCLPCAEEIDAARYAEMARTVLSDIVSRGKTPIVVGGSGLYLQALISGLPTLPAIAPALRGEVRAMTLEAMIARMRELDPDSLAVIDVNNPRRVARRLELCLQTGRPASRVLPDLSATPSGLRGVFFTRIREDLFARIAAAVALRLEGGAVEEVEAVRNMAGYTARQILGWREITALLDGVITMEECRERLVVATRKYAKRQLTWFRGKSTFPEEDISAVTPDTLERIAHRLGLT